jgi:hypothetical protein
MSSKAKATKAIRGGNCPVVKNIEPVEKPDHL